MNLDDEAGQGTAERARLEDRLARARRRHDQSALILVEQRQRAELAEEAGLRVTEAKALLEDLRRLPSPIAGPQQGVCAAYRVRRREPICQLTLMHVTSGLEPLPTH
jgi:hypothetical protein